MPARADKSIEIIQRHLNALCDLKVPFLFCARPRKEMIYRGTMNCIKVFDEHKRVFEEALKADIKLLCQPSNPDNIVVVQNTETFELERMKTPLSLANTDELRQYIRYLIMLEHRENFPESKEKQIKYGKDEWKTSFWPQELMPWEKVVKNFSDMKNDDVPGKTTMVQVLREAVKRALIGRNVDPEDYYDSSFDKKKDVKRKRIRGINSVPEVFALNGDGTHESVPLDLTFKPRRPSPIIEVEEHEIDSDVEAEETLMNLENLESVSPLKLFQPGRPETRYSPLPDYLKKLAPGKRILENGGGGLCLAIGQFLGVDPVELRQYANEHLFVHYMQYIDYITYPITIKLGIGGDERVFDNEMDFCTFLLSEDSIYSWNSGDVEIVVFATLIGQPITVVHYKQQGFPPGTAVENRCDIKVYNPFDYNFTDFKYRRDTGPMLLYEDLVHFSLLVDEPPVSVTADDQQFIDNLYNDLFSKTCDNNNSAENVCSDSSTGAFVTSTLRRSTRLCKKRKIFDNSESFNRKANKKTKASDTLDKLLCPPSLNTRKKEAIANQKDIEILKRREAHEIEMNKLDNDRMNILKNRQKASAEADMLQQQHEMMRKCLKMLKYEQFFKNIYSMISKQDVDLHGGMQCLCQKRVLLQIKNTCTQK